MDPNAKLAVESLDTVYVMKPVNDKVVVRRAEPKQSPTGLVLPDNMKGNRVTEGEILAIGPGCIVQGEPFARHPLQVSIGDKILFSKTAGVEIEVNGEKLVVMHEQEIMVVLSEAKAGVKKS